MKISSNDFIIKEPRLIPYGVQSESYKKNFQKGGSIRDISALKYSIIRLRNYLILLLAYIAPSNKIRVLLNRWKGVNIADGAYIGMFVFIDNAFPDYIYIEENASINAGCMLVAHFNPMKHFRRTVLATVDPIIIKKGAMLGVRVVVNQGVTVGEYSMVSTGSVVTHNVNSYTIVRGNPVIEIGKVRI